MAKDFKGISAGKVKNTIAEATQEAPATQEEPKKRKERKTYTAQEVKDYSNALDTTGRKGMKLPRINIAFTPDNYDYVKTMSRVTGQNYTEFINKILLEHREAHGELYKQVVKFRNSL